MTKWANDSVLDSTLNAISSSGNTMVVCSSQPANYTEATTTYKLAQTSLSPADYSLSDDPVSGRLLTIAEKQNVDVTDNGTSTHVAVCSGSDLLYVTTCSNQIFETGNKLVIPSWTINIKDPV